MESDYKLLRQQPDGANLFDSLRFDLDYDDHPGEEHLRTELYWYYNPAGASLSFLVNTQIAHAFCVIDGDVYVQATAREFSADHQEAT